MIKMKGNLNIEGFKYSISFLKTTSLLILPLIASKLHTVHRR